MTSAIFTLYLKGVEGVQTLPVLAVLPKNNMFLFGPVLFNVFIS